jgi:cytoskeletal protein CcmA (bactofilin family)
MESSKKRKVSITGTGSTSGGVFHSVKIMGEGQVNGALESESFRCMGTCSVKGDLKTKRYRQVGENTIEGDLYSSELSVLGQIGVTGSMRGGTMKITGQLDVGGECEAELFQAKGGFHVHGLLNADKVEIRTVGPCHAKEIGGGRISVRQSKWGEMKQWFLRQGPTELTAETIEGDQIYLEYTKADVVRGSTVILGPGCKIGQVEYRNSLRKNKSAAVNAEKKI